MSLARSQSPIGGLDHGRTSAATFLRWHSWPFMVPIFSLFEPKKGRGGVGGCHVPGELMSLHGVFVGTTYNPLFFKRLVELVIRIRLSLLVRIARCSGGFLLEAFGSRLLGSRLDRWARHARTVRVP